MLRPSDIEIWQVLDGRDDRNAKKVASWLSSEEGLAWIESNTDRIMKYCEDTADFVDVPSEEMLEKIGYVADYEGRSVNSHVLVLIRESIRKFEQEHGVIDGAIDSAENVKPARKYTQPTEE